MNCYKIEKNEKNRGATLILNPVPRDSKTNALPLCYERFIYSVGKNQSYTRKYHINCNILRWIVYGLPHSIVWQCAIHPYIDEKRSIVLLSLSGQSNHSHAFQWRVNQGDLPWLQNMVQCTIILQMRNHRTLRGVYQTKLIIN